VKLGVHPAFGPADQAPTPTFLAPGWRPCDAS
jgi:hypothetical protein